MTYKALRMFLVAALCPVSLTPLQLTLRGVGLGGAAASASAPTFESANSVEDTDAGTISMTATTCTGSNKVMIIGVDFNSSSDVSFTTATYNGTDITGSKIAATAVNFTNAAIFVVVNPVSAATFAATTTSNANSMIVTACYNGVNQTTPNRTATTGGGTTNPGTLAVTNSQTNDRIIGFFGLNDTSSANGMTAARVGAGQTSRITTTSTSTESAGSISDEAGASGTVTHSWDFVNDASNGWNGIAIPLIPN